MDGVGGPQIDKGFSNVDGQPDVAPLVAGMDQTALWPAVRRLRAWERERLALQPGQRVLDAGCGAGDVTIDLARAVGPDGGAVGLDFSSQMLAEATRRVAAAGVAAELVVGSMTSLDFADDTFDAARSERTLQWLDDPDAGVAELVRVTRPGGRLVVIDADWSTLRADTPDPVLFERFIHAFAALRPPSVWVGGRLVNLVRDVGLAQVQATAATHLWLSWDPDTEPAPSGFFPLRAVAQDLAATGALPPEDAERFVAMAEEQARRDRFFMSLTLIAVAGVVV